MTASKIIMKRHLPSISVLIIVVSLSTTVSGFTHHTLFPTKTHSHHQGKKEESNTAERDAGSWKNTVNTANSIFCYEQCSNSNDEMRQQSPWRRDQK